MYSIEMLQNYYTVRHRLFLSNAHNNSLTISY